MLNKLRRALVLRALNLLYDRFAWAYDAVSTVVSLGRWQSWGEAALPFLAGSRVLELGHGPGHLLPALLAGGRVAIGVDLSSQMGRLAARRLARLGLPARLVRGRGQALPFTPTTFDAVVAIFPAPYVLESNTLTAAWRALRPGGRLVLVPEAAFDPSGALARAVEWLHRLAGRRRTALAQDDLLWEQALTPHGFRVETRRVRVGDSTVTVVIAERPSVP